MLHAVNAIFKGGTSLSRVYGLIERFSEDVDLLIRFPSATIGKGARDKVLKHIRDVVAQHLQLDSENVVQLEATTGVKRNVRYSYPTFERRQSSIIAPSVLLEMGCRGGTHPTHRNELRSMVAEFAIDELGEAPGTWDEFAAVSVEVLAPERTLLEKLALLHDCAVRQLDERTSERLRKAGRHVYDVHCLLRPERVTAVLNELGPAGIAELCADIDEHSTDAGFPSTPRPSGGYGDSPLLDPSAPCQSLLGESYQVAMQFVYGHRPTIEECLQTIRDSTSRL
ncbi:nucleotidyl transferase AbiEii/AbiGii toxin family protein [Mycobacterium heidelbergense]|uniref:Uncharacterized protein n=1 Tax=Mycobacterium heidelbergense TaxID=53376 RepID=A0A1X0DIV2_MYCHE|nr:nucleotidyl transferase AbiEii/AbiGii toxin family protein [Mycobacterium heidelbergense]MCV7050315.1 nucleotidyl transferase AbiEii/AbiGii toxin family protein [Mycobacterium heidelbergense]ORA72122.1 hypothetical protein BST25_15600 [Mycobacterium heidelbergense]BBZ50545.1 hypothetical protein MHEI_22620 [Mycobacterium heidelbergense]